MRRIAFYVATALITFIAGISVTGVWKSLDDTLTPRIATLSTEIKPSPQTGTSNLSDEQEIRELFRQYEIAQTQHDAAFFERVEADSFICTTTEGTVFTRDQDIAYMMSWDKNSKYTIGDLHIQFYGDVATVTEWTTETSLGSETGYSIKSRWIHLLKKSGGRWQIWHTAELD
jgi:ketosteroid isomerase-like protein